MPKEKLKQSLTRLHQEISHLPDEAAHHRRELENLHDKASALLSEKTDTSDHLTLLDEFRKTAARFEVSHPDLTDGINQVLNALSNMGI